MTSRRRFTVGSSAAGVALTLTPLHLLPVLFPQSTSDRKRTKLLKGSPVKIGEHANENSPAQFITHKKKAKNEGSVKS